MSEGGLIKTCVFVEKLECQFYAILSAGLIGFFIIKMMWYTNIKSFEDRKRLLYHKILIKKSI